MSGRSPPLYLHESPCRDTRKTVKTKQKQCSTPSNMVVITYYYVGCKYKAITWYLKKNKNAPRPSEHCLVRGQKNVKLLGGIKSCKYKTSSWHLNGFLDGNNIGSTVKCREKPTVMLYTDINRHVRTPEKQ